MNQTAIVDCDVATKVPRKQVDRILEEVANYYECGDLRIRSKVPSVVEPRQLACFLAWRAGYTNSEFGRIIERDHSTVLHSIRMTRRRLYRLYDAVKEIEARVQAKGFQQAGYWRRKRIAERGCL